MAGGNGTQDCPPLGNIVEYKGRIISAYSSFSLMTLTFLGVL